MSQLIYLAGAYLALWIAFFAYSLRISRKLKRVERDLGLLKK